VGFVKILVADDDDVAVEILEYALAQFGYEVTVARNGREAMDFIRTGQFRIVVSDWEMPEMTGVELCQEIRQRSASGYIYVILLTSRQGTQNVVDGLKSGADDFVNKPFQPLELVMRIRAGQRILSLESRELIIFSLAKLAESRDPETGAHLERIREYCRVLARHLAHQPKFQGALDGDYVQLLYLTSPLHDIGKVGIPDRILLKPGKLTPEEFEIMKRHPVIGAETLAAAAEAHPEAKFLGMARDIARSHHEKFDGSGYPDGLSGEQIPLCGRIVALADVYDALTTKRVYKAAFSHQKAADIIREGRGKHFDPDMVDAFEANEERFVAICQQWADREESEALAIAERQVELALV
jgi:putative two-component system response regulator